MSRIEQRFQAVAAAGKRALIPYIAAGDPGPQDTVPMMRALVESGADVLELGVPFSDPMADGRSIQAAYERSLLRGTTLASTLDMVAEFRCDDRHTPIVLMGYMNPIEAMGLHDFAARAAQAGVDGVLTVDLPVEEAEEAVESFSENGMDTIFLLSPTTPEARIGKICSIAGGFVYYVSLKGVTGAEHLDIHDVRRHVEIIRRHTELPVGVGFGVKNAEAAARVAEIADAVVVGSVLVDVMGRPQPDASEKTSSAAALLSSMRAAMDAPARIRA